MPGPIIRNGFAMAALRAADGAFLCGQMGEHTANAGKVYFAAGTPDREDRPRRRHGSTSPAASTRELCEETGLTHDEITVGGGLDGGDHGGPHRLHAAGHACRCRPRRRAP